MYDTSTDVIYESLIMIYE